jgi:hypothetical protein
MGSPGNVDPLRSCAWTRNRKLVFTQASHVELDGATDQPPHFWQRTTSHSDTREVRHVRTVSLRRSLNDDQVIHRDHLRPAFFRMPFNVPGGTSAEGWPATVTRPDFAGCLN